MHKAFLLYLSNQVIKISQLLFTISKVIVQSNKSAMLQLTMYLGLVVKSFEASSNDEK